MTEPLPTLPLVTVEQYAELMQGGVISQVVLDAAIAAVRRYCGWHVAPVRTETITITAPAGDTMFLPSLRVLEIQGIQVDGVLRPPPYDFDTSGMVSGSFTGARRFGGCRVSLTHGFDVADVAALVCSIAARFAETPTGAVQETAGSLSLTAAQTAPGVSGGIVLMLHEKASLDLYRVRP